MSNTVITIEIATALKTALAAVVSDDITFYVDGVLDDTSEGQDKFKCPCVVIVVNECLPQQYRSVIREYPVTIEANTWYPADKDQAELYTMMHGMSQWLAEPTLSLTLAVFDAITIQGTPDRDVAGNLQYCRWQTLVHTTKAES